MGCSASRPEIVLNITFQGCAGYFLTSRSNPRSLRAGVTTISSEAPKTRSFPAPVVHHPPIWKGDSHHLVSLTSTTYGSLLLVDHQPASASAASDFDGRDFADQSYSPDSVINAWELMEGLEDDDDDSVFCSTEQNPRHSLDTCRNPNPISGEFVRKSSDSYPFVETSREITEDWSSNSDSKPLWKHLSEESLVSKSDTNAPSTYQRASSSTHFGIARTRIKTRSVDSTPIASRFSSVTSSPLLSTPSNSTNLRQIPCSEDKIVLYFTSLRGIRKTYDDCCAVRMILSDNRLQFSSYN